VSDVLALASLLREHGLRVTGARLAVLGTLSDSPHATVDEVVTDARRRLGTLSTQAGYDVLAVLVERGLARRFEPAGSPARFELRVGDNHHHMVCRSCGRVEDVDCAIGSAPCRDPIDDHGFTLDEAEVTYWGTCPTCAAADRSPDIIPVRP